MVSDVMQKKKEKKQQGKTWSVDPFWIWIPLICNIQESVRNVNSAMKLKYKVAVFCKSEK